MALGTALFAASYVLSNNQDPQDDARPYVSVTLPVPEAKEAQIHVFHELVPLQIEKISPKHNWEFRFATNGLVKLPTSQNFNLRFRTFAQSRRGDYDDVAQWTTRLLLRLWSYNYYRLGRDNPEAYRKLIDVYLCFAGDAGGEHLFDLDTGDLDSNNKPAKVNTIYIYQVASPIPPVELVREIAHEYGHATLPGVGIYNKPENWANGDVGERVYLNWLYQDLKANVLHPYDVMKADVPALQNYVKTKVEPLVNKISKTGPDLTILEEKVGGSDEKAGERSQKAYDEYVALATYAANVLPPKAFNKAMDLGGQDPAAFAKAVVETSGTAPTWSYSIPDYLKGQALYMPIAGAKVQGGKVLQKKGDWVKVQPLGPKLTFTNTGR